LAQAQIAHGIAPWRAGLRLRLAGRLNPGGILARRRVLLLGSRLLGRLLLAFLRHRLRLRVHRCDNE
jgi:hypothetical protein